MDLRDHKNEETLRSLTPEAMVGSPMRLKCGASVEFGSPNEKFVGSCNYEGRIGFGSKTACGQTQNNEKSPVPANARTGPNHGVQNQFPSPLFGIAIGSGVLGAGGNSVGFRAGSFPLSVVDPGSGGLPGAGGSTFLFGSFGNFSLK